MYAYDKLYLSQAQRNLGRMADYAAYDLKLNPDEFMGLFSRSLYGQRFEKGDISVISGLSGTELTRRVLDEFAFPYTAVKPRYTLERSREYWAGWALAYFQWYSGVPFHKIFESLSFSDIIALYDPYHEMSIGHFLEQIETIIHPDNGTTALKRLRKANGLTQKKLAERSGVPLRTIQQYEQRQKPIEHAAAERLRDLARVLNCDIEELFNI